MHGGTGRGMLPGMKELAPRCCIDGAVTKSILGMGYAPVLVNSYSSKSVKSARMSAW